jgi:hypothetical protein
MIYCFDPLEFVQMMGITILVVDAPDSRPFFKVSTSLQQHRAPEKESMHISSPEETAAMRA